MSSSKQIPLSRRIAVSVEGSKSIFYAEKSKLSQRKKKEAFPPNFLVSRFSVNEYIPQIDKRFAQNSSETIHLRKITSPGN